MDAGTQRFYERYAVTGATEESPRSAMFPYIQRLLPPPCTVLDVGAGAGRDVAAMLDLGLDAWGVEPHAAMRECAGQRFPATRGRLGEAALPALGRPFAQGHPQGFDAIVCSAVLMHVAPAELPVALAAMAGLLRPRPAAPAVRMLLALPEMAAQRLLASRDQDGRCFHNHAPATLQGLLAGHGLRLHEATVNDAVRASTGTRWHMLAFADA